MDVGTITGCALGSLLILCAILLGGHDGFAPFWNTPSLFIVFGGTLAAVLVAFPFQSVLKALVSVRTCFANPTINPQKIVDQLVFFAESTRREGLLAQESRLDDLREPFLAEGLHLIVDGIPPATVESILNSRIEAIQHRHQQNRNIILHCGRCAPAFGMIGTLIGLVLMLTRLDAETVGPGMAVAILTTFYGLISAHLFFLPIAEKLKQLHDAEMQIKTMIVRGVRAIQSGEHPRIIQQKLLTFFPPVEGPDSDKQILNDVQVLPFPTEDDRTDATQAA